MAFNLATLTRRPTYYVNTGGSDAADGLTEATAWQTIAKVNAQAFVPGTRVRFRGGQTFSGGLVASAASQSFGSYGGGRATISSGASAGLTVTNLAGVAVRDLIFVGSGIATNATHGILFENNQAGNTKLQGVTIYNCDVSQYGHNGIWVLGNNGYSGFDGVSIVNCVAHDNTGVRTASSAGIRVSSLTGYGLASNGASHTNVTISGCTANGNTGVAAGASAWTGSGIVVGNVDTCTIASCIAFNNGANNALANAGPVGIWCYDSRAVTIQFCESYSNKTNSNTDGGGFDIDGGCVNCTIQYCYSHDNQGSGFQIYSYADPPYLLQDSGNTVRYCVSENDGTRNSTSTGGFLIGTDSALQMLNLRVYNNTVYQSGATANAIYFYPGSGTLSGAIIANNILQTASTAYLVKNSGAAPGATLHSNVYYAGGSFKILWAGVDYTTYAAWRTASGQEAAGAGLSSNPLLTSPGAGGTLGGNLAALSAYKLQGASPARNAGASLNAMFGINPGTRDFYANPIPAGVLFDIGAHEFT